MKIGDLSVVFSVQGTGGSPTAPNLGNRVGDQDTGSPGRLVFSGLQVCTTKGKWRRKLQKILNNNYTIKLT
jgi:hypothetical protein